MASEQFFLTSWLFKERSLEFTILDFNETNKGHFITVEANFKNLKDKIEKEY